MPKEVKSGQKNVEGVLNQHTYPSSVDNMMRNDKVNEGSESALPPSGTNPVKGADGTLPVTKVIKTK